MWTNEERNIEADDVEHMSYELKKQRENIQNATRKQNNTWQY